MQTWTPRALAAIRSSHAARSRIDAYLSGTLVRADLPVTGGSVTIDAGSAVRRQLTVAATSLAGLQAVPYGLELRAYRGVAFGSSVDWVPLGVFSVDTTAEQAIAGTTVTCPDRSRGIARFGFLNPTGSDTGHTAVQEIQRLMHDAAPTFPVVNLDVDATEHVPWLAWDAGNGRWQAIADLAASVGAEVFFDPNGTLVIRRIRSIDAPVGWYANTGPTGVLVGYSRQISREETYNGVVAVSERTDGAVPVRAEAFDLDPASPTYYAIDSTFGRATYFLSSPILTTQAGAQRAADGQLAIKRAFGRQVSLQVVPNAALDAGDIIGAQHPDGAIERYMVDRLTVPLDAVTTMAVEARTPSPLLLITDLPPVPLPPDPEPPLPGEDPYDPPPPELPYDPPPDTPTPNLPPEPLPPPLVPLPDPPGPPELPQYPQDPPGSPGDGPPGDGDPGGGLPGEPPHDPDLPGDPPYDPGLDLPQPPPGGFPARICFTHVIQGPRAALPTRVFIPVTIPVPKNPLPSPPSHTLIYYHFANPIFGVGLLGLKRDPDIASPTVDFLGPDGGAYSGYYTANSGDERYGNPTYEVLAAGLGSQVLGSGSIEVVSALRAPEEHVPLAYLPDLLPEAEVWLDGAKLDPLDGGYDIDFQLGYLIVKKALGAVVGQHLKVCYTTQGGYSPGDGGTPAPTEGVGDL